VNESQSASVLQLAGAFAFGLVLGWYLYYVNRYRKSDVQLADLVTIVSVLGGGAVLALFPPRSDLFGAYGVGLFVGFFAYFAILCFLVNRSPDFGPEWFLDGRRRRPQEPYYIPDSATPTARAMQPPPGTHINQ
jgi:hypothetical protein